jgi:hypothetical protein
LTIILLSLAPIGIRHGRRDGRWARRNGESHSVKSEAEELLALLVPSYFKLIDQLRKREEIATMMESAGESDAFNMAIGYTYAAFDDLMMHAEEIVNRSTR